MATEKETREGTFQDVIFLKESGISTTRIRPLTTGAFIAKGSVSNDVLGCTDLPMDPIRNIKLRWLHGALQDLTSELSRLQFSRFAPQAWEPAINAYRCEKSIRICVDLAGVDRALIDLTVEPRRVVIRGTRELPEPTDDEGCALQLLAMEIDYGPFIREVPLPAEVEIEQAHAEQRNGLLWISLSLKES
jgi:HSP20 family molecular chaperone IbpA